MKKLEPASREDALLSAIAALHEEVRALRRGQQRLMTMLHQTRHELGHKVSTTREELGALVKASHAELSERYDELGRMFDNQQQRLEGLEQDLDGIFEMGGRG